MAVLNFLGMLSDLGFYYAFAGVIIAHNGGSATLTNLLIACLCFALSALPGRWRPLRVLAICPVAVCLLLPGEGLADWLGLLPPVCYLLYLAWTGRYTLSRSRQAQLFSVFWKAFLPFALLFSLMGLWRQALSVGLPVAMIMMVSAVISMRSLRHEPEVYLQWQFQLVNLLSVGALLLAAWVLSRRAFLRAALLVVKGFYLYVIAPLILALGYCLAGIAQGLGWILSKLGIRGTFLTQQTQESTGELKAGILGEGYEGSGSGGLVGRILLALGILAVAVGLFFLFRWMARRPPQKGPTPVSGTRTVGPRREARASSPGESSGVHRVRRQYRKYLRLCQEKGAAPADSDTSLDVECHAAGLFDQEAQRELRQLYLKARYAGEATSQDVARAKELVKELKGRKGN